MAPTAMAPELAAALMPDEPASAYLRRSAPVPVRTGLWFAPALRPGQAVEFVGPSGSGKTALLVQAAAAALSRGEPVLLIDADATFDVERLAAALRARFRHLRGTRSERGGEGGGPAGAAGATEREETEPLVAAALLRLGLLQCHSPLELLSALVTLRASIEGLERRSCCSGDSSQQQRVRLVLLDNAAAFYWPLRAAAAAGTQQQQQQQLTLSTMAAASARALKRALKGSGAAALVTRHAVFPAAPAAAGPGGGKEEGSEWRRRDSSREFFPASWLSVASRRADLAAVGSSFASEAPRVRLTWRASAAGAAGGGGGGIGGDAAPPQQQLLFDLTDAGLVPL